VPFASCFHVCRGAAAARARAGGLLLLGLLLAMVLDLCRMHEFLNEGLCRSNSFTRVLITDVDPGAMSVGNVAQAASGPEHV
jgi:hypothetical protein